MTYQEAIDYATPYINMVGAFYKFGEGDTDFDKATIIKAVLASPVDFQKETYTIWLNNGNNNEAAVGDFDKNSDEFDTYIYFGDGSPSLTLYKPLRDYLIEGGFISI